MLAVHGTTLGQSAQAHHSALSHAARGAHCRSRVAPRLPSARRSRQLRASPVAPRRQVLVAEAPRELQTRRRSAGRRRRAARARRRARRGAVPLKVSHCRSL